jgi:hypothetical protein
MTGVDRWGDSVAVTATPSSALQHMRALARANRVRLARAEVKRQVANGEVDAASVVLSDPWQVNGMSVSELLTSQRRWGRTRCRRLCLSLGIAENKPVGALTQRQRKALAQALGKPNPDDRVWVEIDL